MSAGYLISVRPRSRRGYRYRRWTCVPCATRRRQWQQVAHCISPHVVSGVLYVLARNRRTLNTNTNLFLFALSSLCFAFLLDVGGDLTVRTEFPRIHFLVLF